MRFLDKLTYQQICFIIYGLIILTICACPLFGATHWVLEESADGSSSRIVSVMGSPLCLKQPHSLVDFLTQREIVEDVKEYQQDLDKHVEKAFYAESQENDKTRDHRAKDPNCIETKHEDFKPATFLTFMAYDMMPFFTHSDDFPVPPKAAEILSVEVLRKLFFRDLKPKKNAEPMCHKVFFSSTQDNIMDIVDTMIENYAPEKELINLGEEELNKLAELLAAGLEDKKYRQIALYYSGFYWRYLGKHREAASCIHKHLISKGITTAGLYQIACVHVHGRDYHHALAVFSIKTLNDGYNAQWYSAGGDVYVLAQWYETVDKYYQKALELATEQEVAAISIKSKLVKCERAVQKVATNPQSQRDRDEYSLLMHNWDQKQMEMHKRMLPIDKWLKDKYAYEFLTNGPIPGLVCKGTSYEQRWDNSAKTRTLQRLDCDVESRHKYEEAMQKKRFEKRAKAAKDIDELMLDIQKAAHQKEAYLNYMLEGHTANLEYMKKLKPYLSLTLDEPQGAKLYPKKLSKPKAVPDTSVLVFRGKECQGLESFNVEQLYDSTKNNVELVFNFPYFPELFVAPDNKGYLVSHLLTTLVALSPGEISPLPWSEPHCQGYLLDKLDGDTVLFPGLKLDDFSSNLTKGLRYREKTLRLYFSKILGPSTQAVAGDVGQRIATTLRYEIGPRWMSANLAALYWRHMGNIREAATCLKLALDYKEHDDVALVQLAQLAIRLGKEFIPVAKRMINKAIQVDGDEPVTHYISGFISYLSGSFYSSRMEFLRTLELEPVFPEAKIALRSIACVKRSRGLWSTRTQNQPMCCWPGEQSVYCFEEDAKRGQNHCFKMEIKDEARKRIDFQYVRCNGKYFKHSFKALGLYHLLSPYFISTLEIEQVVLQRRILNISATSDDEDKILPVFALDSGGWGEDRFKVYEQEPLNLDDYEQGMIDFGPVRETRLRKEQELKELQKARLNETEVDEKVKLLNTFTERNQVIQLDVDLPAYLPEPTEELVKKGLVYLKPPKQNTLADYCVMIEKNKRVLDHPSPTYISVTAKGVKLEEYVDLTAPVTTITKNEPICPEVELSSEWSLLDDLPAFRFREYFKFYKPETAMTETLMSLGYKHERVEHVAARLHLAMKTSRLNEKQSHLQDDGVNGVITAVSTLYWRVKGDAVNALTCLRHSLKNLPQNMKDTALISMANIYHQAGFLHSALVVGGKAHQKTPDLVSIHFTLANIYATMGDHTRALKFYYSTLALQPTFQPAKERIRAIYCLTRGKVRI